VRQILVVEDDAHIGSVISSILSAHIVLVEDAASGILALESSRFDLVIVDIFLPGMDDFIAKVKGRLTLPIIAMTGVGTSEFMHAGLDFTNLAIKAGATCCVRKPFSPKQLLRAVNSCLAPTHLRDRCSVAKQRQTSPSEALSHSDTKLAIRPHSVAKPTPRMDEERDGTTPAVVTQEMKESLAILLLYLRKLQREAETNPLSLCTTREMTKCALLETERACRMVNSIGRDDRKPCNTEDMIALDSHVLNPRPKPRDNFVARSERDRLTPREREVLALVSMVLQTNRAGSDYRSASVHSNRTAQTSCRNSALEMSPN
jgi:DNA-binding response OmpR family regulator